MQKRKVKLRLLFQISRKLLKNQFESYDTCFKEDTLQNLEAGSRHGRTERSFTRNVFISDECHFRNCLQILLPMNIIEFQSYDQIVQLIMFNL